LPSAPLPPDEAPPSLGNLQDRGGDSDVKAGDVEKPKSSSEVAQGTDLMVVDAPPLPAPKPTSPADVVDVASESKCVPSQVDNPPLPPPVPSKPVEGEQELQCQDKSVPLQSKPSQDVQPPLPCPKTPITAELAEPKSVAPPDVSGIAVEATVDCPSTNAAISANQPDNAMPAVSASNVDDPQLEELKERMRGMLEKAAGSGQLESALAALVPPDGGTGTSSKSQGDLGLSELELRGRMGEMLQKAAASGELSVALAGLTDYPCDAVPPDSGHDADLKCQLASVLQRAAASGQLEVALADVVRAEEQMGSAAPMAVVPQQADDDINVNELRDRLCGVLERASESGHLERALSMARGLEQAAEKPPEKPDASVNLPVQDALEIDECKSRPPPDYVEDEPRKDSRSTSVILENVNEVKKMYENLSKDTQELHQTVEGMASTLCQLRKENQELRDKIGPSSTGSTDR